MSRNRPDRSERKSAVTTWRRTPPAGGDTGSTARSTTGPAAGSARRKTASSSAQHWQTLFALHRQVSREALVRILATPVASLMTILVLGIALAFPAALSMTLENLQEASGNASAIVRVSLYLDSKTSDARALDLRRELQKDPAIREVVYISPRQGLMEFEKYSGLGQALKLLDDNPLPGVLEVEPVETAPLAVSNLKNRLVRLGGVEEVRLDDIWLKRLHAIVTLGERVLNGLITLVVLAVLMAVGNTIRLLVVNRQDEIRVIKLVGGSDGFVILPFLYSGFWYGLLGGLLAWLMTAGLWFLVAGSANAVATLYQSTFQMNFPDLLTFIVLVSGSALLGVVGAFATTWRQLRHIDP